MPGIIIHLTTESNKLTQRDLKIFDEEKVEENVEVVEPLKL